jgi:hypothetical protein
VYGRTDGPVVHVTDEHVEAPPSAIWELASALSAFGNVSSLDIACERTAGALLRSGLATVEGLTVVGMVRAGDSSSTGEVVLLGPGSADYL